MKNIINRILILIGVLILSSCSIDNIEPQNQMTEENMIQDVASAQNILNRVYTIWPRDFVYNSRFMARVGTLGIENVNSGGISLNDFPENNVRSENSYVEKSYKGHYGTINLANFLIEHLEAGDAGTSVRVDEMVAEAKYLRAWSHFQLLKYWGQFYNTNSAIGVVTSTTPFRSAEARPRSTVQEVYDVIIADLKDAVENGPTGQQRFYNGKGTAQALLCKVQLYMGDYTNAAITAKAVMDNIYGYGLESAYEDIFLNQWGKEAFQSPFNNGSLNSDYNNAYLAWSTRYVLPSPYLHALADAQVIGDPSLDGDGMGYDPRFIFAYSDNRPKATANSREIGKYSQDIFTESPALMLLRMGEIYLIHAEAEVRLGGDLNVALADLNTIRTRAGVSPKTLSDAATLLNDIREEKMLELFAENSESWFDLIRYHMLGDIDAFSMKETLNSVNQFILPIPLKALAGNPKLEQNPGYEGQ